MGLEAGPGVGRRRRQHGAARFHIAHPNRPTNTRPPTPDILPHLCGLTAAPSAPRARLGAASADDGKAAPPSPPPSAVDRRLRLRVVVGVSFIGVVAGDGAGRAGPGDSGSSAPAAERRGIGRHWAGRGWLSSYLRDLGLVGTSGRKQGEQKWAVRRLQALCHCPQLAHHPPPLLRSLPSFARPRRPRPARQCPGPGPLPPRRPRPGPLPPRQRARQTQPAPILRPHATRPGRPARPPRECAVRRTRTPGQQPTEYEEREKGWWDVGGKGRACGDHCPGFPTPCNPSAQPNTPHPLPQHHPSNPPPRLGRPAVAQGLDARNLRHHALGHARGRVVQPRRAVRRPPARLQGGLQGGGQGQQGLPGGCGPSLGVG